MTGGGIERAHRIASAALTGRVPEGEGGPGSASDTTGATKSAAKYRPYLAPALVSTTGLPRRVGGRIARRIAAASRQGLSAQWRGTGAVTGGD